MWDAEARFPALAKIKLEIYTEKVYIKKPVHSGTSIFSNTSIEKVSQKSTVSRNTGKRPLILLIYPASPLLPQCFTQIFLFATNTNSPSFCTSEHKIHIKFLKASIYSYHRYCKLHKVYQRSLKNRSTEW